MLDPLADDPQVDADLREFTRRNVFACGPLPTLRVGAQPYGVLPVVSSRHYEPGGGQAEELVHRVATLMRDIVTPGHRRRAAPAPGGRGPGRRRRPARAAAAHAGAVDLPLPADHRPDRAQERRASAGTWSTPGSGPGRPRCGRGWASYQLHPAQRAHPRQGPPAAGAARRQARRRRTRPATSPRSPTCSADPHGRTALNLREDSIALLEALAACSAVMEIDRAALKTIRDRRGAARRGSSPTLPALRKLAVADAGHGARRGAPAVAATGPRLQAPAGSSPTPSCRRSTGQRRSARS